MNVTTTVVLTGALEIIGRWVNKKDVDVRLIMALTVMGVTLNVLENANEKFARQVALLLLVIVALKNLQPVIEATLGKPSLKTMVQRGGR